MLTRTLTSPQRNEYVKNASWKKERKWIKKIQSLGYEYEQIRYARISHRLSRRDSLHIPSDFEWSEKAVIAPDCFVGEGCIVAIVSWAHSVICSY